MMAESMINAVNLWSLIVFLFCLQFYGDVDERND